MNDSVILITMCILLLPSAIAAQPSSQPSAELSQHDEGAVPSPFADSVARGVVWHPPDAVGPALRELNRIRVAGATAVRLTAPPPTASLFTRADSLDLQLFLDIPISHVTASGLSDSLTAKRPLLTRIRTLSKRHSSIRYVGLARHANTTTPETCSVLRSWTTRLHRDSSDLRTYYVTPFRPSTDRCAGAVDLPLFDTRTWENPVARLNTTTRDSTQAGLGALGTWMAPNAGSGLRVPHSPERQARFLERSLSGLEEDSAKSQAPVFAYRWADRASTRLPNRHYGLHDASGGRRAAAEVVDGFYTGSQRVFAFPSGTAPPSSPHALILVGWGLLLLVAGLFAGRPFVRQTAYRYFVAHGFYRDAIREGRDVAPWLNVLLLGVCAAAAGLIATVGARLAASLPITEHLLAVLPPILSTPLAGGIVHPHLGGLAVGVVTLALFVAWTGILSLTARSISDFSLAQSLMLVVWPCWPVLPGMILALVAATSPPLSPVRLGGIVAAGSIVGSLYLTGRVLHDYRVVTGVSPGVAIALALPSPPILVGLTLSVIAVQKDLPVSLLWDLLTKT